MIIYNNGKVYDSEDLAFVERVVELRKNKDPWVVIDELIRYWGKKAPDEEEALQIMINDQKEFMEDPVYGQTSGGGDVERRLILAFPMTLQLLIRSQYKADELPFDMPFYKEFLKRYPMFQVAQKV